VEVYYQDLSLFDIMKYYTYFLIVLFALIGAYQETMMKGSYANKAIRHYFNLPFLVEYTAEDPLELIRYESEVPICNYTEMTPKKFFVEFVS